MLRRPVSGELPFPAFSEPDLMGPLNAQRSVQSADDLTQADASSLVNTRPVVLRPRLSFLFLRRESLASTCSGEAPVHSYRDLKSSLFCQPSRPSPVASGLVRSRCFLWCGQFPRVYLLIISLLTAGAWLVTAS